MSETKENVLKETDFGIRKGNLVSWERTIMENVKRILVHKID